MKKLVIAFVITVCIPIQSWSVGSGGYTNQVVGSKALGMGNAFVATADDPSAIYFNPAGLTQIPSSMFSIGLAPVFSDTKYSGSGTSDSMDKATPIVPNVYGSVPFKSNWVFGLGLNSPFGLETHWGDNSPLRYVATDSKLSLVNFNPTIAYRANEKVSVGVGVVYGMTNATLRSKLNQTAINTVLNGVLSPTADGGKKLDGDGDGWGYDVGVLLKPSEAQSIGMTYRSEIRAKVEGETELSGLSGTAALVFGGDKYSVDTETELRFPASFVVGYAYKPSKWTFEIDGEWVDYSTVDETALTFKGESDPIRLALLNTGNPIPRDWHNTWNLGLGTNYQFNETWQARGGYFYYPQSIPTATWDPGNPESSRNGFTLGGTYSRSAISIDLAYNLILLNDRTINNSVGATSASTVNGSYKTTAHIVSANFNYRFKTNN